MTRTDVNWPTKLRVQARQVGFTLDLGRLNDLLRLGGLLCLSCLAAASMAAWACACTCFALSCAASALSAASSAACSFQPGLVFLERHTPAASSARASRSVSACYCCWLGAFSRLQGDVRSGVAAAAARRLGGGWGANRLRRRGCELPGRGVWVALDGGVGVAAVCPVRSALKDLPRRWWSSAHTPRSKCHHQQAWTSRAKPIDRRAVASRAANSEPVV
jgi:hypothetical protein